MDDRICILPCPDGCHVAWRTLAGEDPHAAGRLLLKQLYGQITGAPLPSIGITQHGKPYFENGDWHFSISHSQKHVFCCLSRGNVGIDAEEAARTVSPRFADSYLSPPERQLWETAQNPADALLRFWVLKEAYAKLTGKGIGKYLKETHFSPDDPRITQIDGCYVAVLTETGKDDTHAF